MITYDNFRVQIVSYRPEKQYNRVVFSRKFYKRTSEDSANQFIILKL